MLHAISVRSIADKGLNFSWHAARLSRMRNPVKSSHHGLISLGEVRGICDVPNHCNTIRETQKPYPSKNVFCLDSPLHVMFLA